MVVVQRRGDLADVAGDRRASGRGRRRHAADQPGQVGERAAEQRVDGAACRRCRSRASRCWCGGHRSLALVGRACVTSKTSTLVMTIVASRRTTSREGSPLPPIQLLRWVALGTEPGVAPGAARARPRAAQHRRPLPRRRPPGRRTRGRSWRSATPCAATCPPVTATELAVLAAAHPLVVSFGDGPPSLAPGGSRRRSWPALLAEVHRAHAAGEWARLKACANPDCQWVYYDGVAQPLGPLVLDDRVRRRDEGPRLPLGARAERRSAGARRNTRSSAAGPCGVVRVPGPDREQGGLQARAFGVVRQRCDDRRRRPRRSVTVARGSARRFPDQRGVVLLTPVGAR